MTKVIDISSLEDGKEYMFRVVYPDANKELIESDWIKIKNIQLWRDSFSQRYYPIDYKEIN